MKINRDIACLLVLLLACGAAHAQTYPGKLIRLVVPFSPGGGLDATARMVADKLGAALGQSVLIENRPGAGGNIGIVYVAKAPPDGYTFLIMSSNFPINPSIYANAGYDPFRDFEPVSALTSYMLFLVSHPSMPIRNVKALIAIAKSPSSRLSYASGGIGTASHFGGELFNHLTGVRITHIPYKGTGPAIYETVGGQVPIMFGVPEVVPHIKAGKLTLIAVTGSGRSGIFPDAPTVAESGVPGYEMTSWHGLFAPAGTPAPIIKRLNDEVRRVLGQPDALEVLRKHSFDMIAGTPQELTALVKTTHSRLSKVVRDAGMKAD